MNTQKAPQFQVEITELKAEVMHLKAQIEVLCQINEALRMQIAEQRKEIVILRKENQELKEKLGTNSSNSSLPPSQDYSRKNQPKQGSGRKPGGQAGHPGHHRYFFPPDQVQKFVEVFPEGCPNCGQGTLDRDHPVSTEQRQQIELPEIKPEVTQYNIHTCRCDKCGEHIAAGVSSEAAKGFGPRLMGFLLILTAEAKATRTVIVKLFGHLGIPISTGSVSNIQKLGSELLAPAYEEIRKATLEQDHVNADETSWKTIKQRKWVWVGATTTTVFFRIDASRSQAAFQRVFGNYQGDLTTDRCNAYNIHKGGKQTCWAHLDRDFAKIAGREGNDGIVGKSLQKQVDLLFGAWKKFTNGEWNREEMRIFAETEIIPTVKSLLESVGTLENIQPKTKRICRALLKRFTSLWLFLYKEGIEPTNNRSERELRSAVIRRKISFGSRSEWGERFIERILTITATFRQLSKNTYQYFTKCFRAKQRDSPVPSPW